LLTTSYLKQAQHNGIISIDEINQYELKYENDFHDEILDFSNEQSINEKDFKNLVNVIQGNIINEHTDIIVICTLSKYLLDSVFAACGNSLKKLFDIKIKENPKTSVIDITTDGKIPSKVIYFIVWQPDSDSNLLYQSIPELLSTIIEKAINENYKSIAFSPIGCDHYGYRIDIYDEFYKQLNSFQQHEQNPIKKSVSITIEKGKIEIEQGDIIKQNVIIIINLK
ncbi:unnamed protein product, partial [Rotaria sp. Silwood2]